ncbi:unnamed protein product [Rangifer tarandus platyrhynchus]|uniref:Uncharacterized protein n=1 Tax=Rangifer tarandus platyrhynchus TaxID=3082113 RepID=A0AC59YV73_RANTA
MWLERDEDSMTTGHRTLQRGSCKVSPELTVPLISRQTPDLGNAIVAGLSEEAVEEDKREGISGYFSIQFGSTEHHRSPVGIELEAGIQLEVVLAESLGSGYEGAKGEKEELAEALVAALDSGTPAALDPGKVEGADFGCCFKSGNDLRGSPFTPGVGVPLERSRVRRRNAILRLFAQHPVGFPQRTMASREPVLSNLTEGYCAALIPPLIILKPVKL